MLIRLPLWIFSFKTHYRDTEKRFFPQTGKRSGSIAVGPRSMGRLTLVTSVLLRSRICFVARLRLSVSGLVTCET